MAFFKRHEPAIEQTGAASTGTATQEVQAERLATPTSTLVPPFVPPGVVPPPAAPIYTMRPPESATHVDGDGSGSLAGKVRMAREALEQAQVSLEGSVRVAARRRRAASSDAQRVGRRSAQPPVRHGHWPRHRQSFDPVAATQAGLLNLAWRWQEAGAPIRAIHAYMQVLARYPGSPGADAAVADLVELSDKLAGSGQFHLALGIYDHLEELLSDPCAAAR